MAVEQKDPECRDAKERSMTCIASVMLGTCNSLVNNSRWYTLSDKELCIWLEAEKYRLEIVRTLLLV